MQNEERNKNFKNTLYRLIELEALPIINENDTIATDEIVIGDNDTLGAIVATSANADLLILLSDIDGLYTEDPHKNPNASLLHEVDEITDEIIAMTGGSATQLGTGGMQTKLHAAQITTQEGIEMVIANGNNPEILYNIVNGENVGTRFKARNHQ